MKKVLLLALFAVLMLSSCITYHWQIGQSQHDFFEMNHKHKRQFQMVKSSETMNVYSIGEGQNITFFYFQNDRLIQVDHGVPSSDIIIENRNR